MDYAIASKHDLGSAGVLTGGQRSSAIAESCHRMGTRLHDDEIGGNAGARRLLTSLRNEPELEDTARRAQRLRVAEMHVASLKMRSSHQLKDCLRFPQPGEVDGSPRATTRTMLLQKRREERMADEERGSEAYHRSIRA